MNIQTCHMACGENTLTLYSIWLIQLSIWDALLFTTVPKSKGMYFSEEKLFPNQTYCHSSISIVAKPLNWQDIRLIRKKRRGACSNFCVLCLLKTDAWHLLLPIFTTKDYRRRNFIILPLQQKKLCKTAAFWQQ